MIEDTQKNHERKTHLLGIIKDQNKHDIPYLATKFVQAEIENPDDVSTWQESDNIYVVWFCYILGGWKALVSTHTPDGKYYEVTHNVAKQETYVDTYVKIDNTQYNV